MKFKRIWTGTLAMTMAFSLLPWNALSITAEEDGKTAEPTASAEPSASAESTPSASSETSDETSVSQEETSTAASYPAFAYAYTDEASNVTVEINAPEGAFPAGVQASITRVDPAEIIDSLKSATGSEDLTGEDITAYDFDFYKGEEHDIEPKQEITVTYQNVNISAGDDIELYHLDGVNDEMPKSEAGLTEKENGKVGFSSSEFSIHALVRRAPVNAREYNEGLKKSVGKTDLYVSVNKESANNRKGDPVPGAVVALYDSDDPNTIIAASRTGEKGYAYFDGDALGLKPYTFSAANPSGSQKTYIAKILNPTEIGFSGDPLVAKDIKLHTTTLLNPVNVIGFVLDNNTDIAKGLTITTWLKDLNENDYVKENVQFCLTDDLGNKIYTEPDNESGIAVFSGLSAKRTYSVSIYKVPAEYADDEAINRLNGLKNHQNIPVAADQLYNYASFEIETSLQHMTFDVVEKGSNDIKINGARFELTADSPYVWDDQKKVTLECRDGALYVVEDSVYKPVNDESGIMLPDGTYTLTQIPYDGEFAESTHEHKISEPLHISVNGRSDQIVIENPLANTENVFTEPLKFNKVWGDNPSEDTVVSFELQQAVLGSGEYTRVSGYTKYIDTANKTVRVQDGSFSINFADCTDEDANHNKQTGVMTFDGLPKFDADGNRLIYRVVETTKMEGWYSVPTVEDGVNTITNYNGYSEGSSRANSYWVSSASTAYKIGVDENGNPTGAVSKISLGSLGNDDEYGHDIAYVSDSEGSWLYGVSNKGNLIRIKNPDEIADNSASVNPDNVKTLHFDGFRCETGYYGDQPAPYSHTMEFSRNGQYLIIGGHADKELYVIQRSYLDEKINAGENINLAGDNPNITKIDITNVIFEGKDPRLTKNPNYAWNYLDGDVIQLEDGDLLFTATNKQLNQHRPSQLWRINNTGSIDNPVWGKAEKAGTIPNEYAAGQNIGGGGSNNGHTIEGLLQIGDTIYFTSTRDHNKVASIVALKKLDDWNFGVDEGSEVPLIGSVGSKSADSKSAALLKDFNSLTGATSGVGSSPSYFVGGKIVKRWEGDTEANRPGSIWVQLYKRTVDENGNIHDEPAKGTDGKTVREELKAGNNWTAEIDASEKKLAKPVNHEFEYVWKEIDVPAGYTSETDEGGHVITNKLVSYDFEFVKKGTDGKVLPGAVFELVMTKDAEGNAVTDSENRYIAFRTSDDNGLVSFKDLKAGTYDLVETKAPEGYKRIEGRFEVEISALDDGSEDSNEKNYNLTQANPDNLKIDDIVEIILDNNKAIAGYNRWGGSTKDSEKNIYEMHSAEWFEDHKDIFWKVTGVNDKQISLENCGNGGRMTVNSKNNRHVTKDRTDAEVYKLVTVAKTSNAFTNTITTEDQKIEIKYVFDDDKISGNPMSITKDDQNKPVIIIKNTNYPPEVNIPHKKTIDAFRDGVYNPDTTLDENAKDTTDLYRLNLDIGPYVSTGTDLVLVLDNSGSMFKFPSDKLDSQYNPITRYVVMNEAVRDFVPGFLRKNEKNRVSIVYFSGRSSGASSLNDIAWTVNGSNGAWMDKKAWMEVVDSNPNEVFLKDAKNDPDGFHRSCTDYVAALMKTQEVLDSSADNPNQKAMMFLSDGIPTEYITNTGKFVGNGDTKEGKDTPAGIKAGKDNEDLVKGPTENAISRFKADNPDLPIAAVAFSDSVESDDDSYALKDLATSKSLFTKTKVKEGISDALNKLTVSNASITDELSQYIELYGDQADFLVTMTDPNGDVTNVYQGELNNGAVTGENIHTDNGVNVVNQIEYTPSDSADSTGRVKVIFNPDYSLRDGYTYTVSFNVRATVEAYEEYIRNKQEPADNGYGKVVGDQGTDYPGNATSSGKAGFHSNKEAKYSVTIGGKEKSEKYDHPVIQVFPQDIEIIKMDKSGNKLGGAEFDLYRAARDTDKQTVKIPTTDIDGVKINKSSLVTANDGKLSVQNLICGDDYYLVETKAPEGFKKLSAPIKFWVKRFKDPNEDDDNEIKVIVMVDKDSSEYASNEGTVNGILPGLPGTGQVDEKMMYVINVRAYSLPKSGGIGTYVFTIFGTALVSLMGMFIISEMKKKREV